MGSSGSGMFGTYRGGGAGSINGGIGFGSGGDIEEIECPLEIQNIKLDDVAISEFYINNSDIPQINEFVELSAHTINKRLVVVLTQTQEIIGNLPVTYNYLNLCIKKGKKYYGKIKSSGISPIPYIVVDLYAK